MSEFFIWTTALWALIVGWSGARVLWHLMSLPEHGGCEWWDKLRAARKAARDDPHNWSV